MYYNLLKWFVTIQCYELSKGLFDGKYNQASEMFYKISAYGVMARCERDDCFVHQFARDEFA